MNIDLARIIGIGAVLVLALFAAANFYRSSQETEQAEQLEQAAEDPSHFERPHSRTLGPADARVTLVEFFDPECEACRAVHPMVKDLLARYPDDVRLVQRYMPLHSNSVYAAGALEAAGAQGRYWEMLDALFRNQPVWGSHTKPRPDLIPGYAKELGLDMAAFERFLEEGSHRSIVAVDAADGKALGVRGTPTFYVNQRLLPRLGYEPLVAMIEEELGR